jgi:hypothetical protein
MKSIKGFLGITGIAVFALLVVGAGLYSFPAQAAGEPAAQLESYPLDAENGAAVCTPDADGMRAYWPFDDGPAVPSFADVIENTAFNNGICVGVNCPTSTVSGKVSSAFTFDGNDEIQVATTTDLDFTIGGEMSVETWVKINDTTPDQCSTRVVFVGRWESNPGAAWWLGCIEGNVAAFHMRDSNNKAITVAGTSEINDGEWHHIVGTRDGTANINKIYVDGVLENSDTPAFTGLLTFTNKDITIGHLDRPTPLYWLDGTLDEMALYDQALPADEVARHYLDGAGQSYCNDDLPIPGGVTFQTEKNTPLNFTKAELLVNDVAPDGGLDLVSYISPSTNGGIITGSDPYTYTPKADFVGTDHFSYKITDKFGTQADGVATVEVISDELHIYLPIITRND